jgi:DNA-binding NtrC family response regulator
VNTPAGEKPDLLIVDDDPLITDTLEFVLGRDFRVCQADSRRQVKALLDRIGRMPELALVDLGLPPTPHRPDEGLRLIGELLAAAPGMKIIVLSGQNDEANARRARALGAIDFVAKPCEPALLRDMLLRARCLGAAEEEAAADGSGILGTSPAIGKLREQVQQYASSPFPVLIEGESGTGKELVARALHDGSARAGQPYLALNCAAISPTLVEPTLFGYVKGAFTGAAASRAGYFEDAAGGTLFLDEIGELPGELQAKLLRVLENGEYQRVGETQLRMSQARVVAATNRDLRQETRAGRFRVDLYHRLSVFTIQMPPLRDLGEDRMRLFQHFSAFYAAQAGVAPCSLDTSAQALWNRYAFPGNVRELRNIAIRLVTKHPGMSVGEGALQEELDLGADLAADLPQAPGFDASPEVAAAVLAERHGIDLNQALRAWERCFVDAAMKLAHGNLSAAARLLGMHRTTLYSRIQALDADTDKAVRPRPDGAEQP